MVTRQRTSRRTVARRSNGRFGRSMNRRTATRRTSARGTRMRNSRKTGTRRSRRTITARNRRLPRRDSHGRFVKRAPVRRSYRAVRPRRIARVSRPRLGSSIVREASERSKAGPALVKRRWWKVDGPVDPDLPAGYAYPR